MKARKIPRAGIWARRLAYALFLLISGLLLAEGAVRLLDLGPERFHHSWHLESPDKRHGIDVYPSNPRGAFDLDLRDEETYAALEAKHIPHLERARTRTPFAVAGSYNAELCRQGPVGPKQPQRARLLIVGDSFSEGQGVGQEQAFAPVLQAMLTERGHSVEVINCGRRGYNFPELAEWCERHLAYDPDLVLYAMILNDPVLRPEFAKKQKFLDDWILDRRRMVLPDEDLPEEPWWQSRLWGLWRETQERLRVGRETTRWYQDVVGPPNQEGFSETMALIEGMHTASERAGARFLVVLLPLFVGLDSGYPFAEAHAAIAAACAERGLDFFDTLPAFLGQEPSSLWVHAVDRHPNQEAHRLIAASLLEPVLARLESNP